METNAIGADSGAIHDWSASTTPFVDRGRLRKAFRSATLWMSVMIELSCWMGGAYIAYWQVPTSVAAIRGHGVETPISMIRALDVCEWIYEWSWIALPLILAGILIPKLLVFARTDDRSMRAACLLAGWPVPLLLLFYVVGTPRMLQLGIWP